MAETSFYPGSFSLSPSSHAKIASRHFFSSETNINCLELTSLASLSPLAFFKGLCIRCEEERRFLSCTRLPEKRNFKIEDKKPPTLFWVCLYIIVRKIKHTILHVGSLRSQVDIVPYGRPLLVHQPEALRDWSSAHYSQEAAEEANATNDMLCSRGTH